jgi:3-deoxy-D-manno-octulosonic-acid transferase
VYFFYSLLLLAALIFIIPVYFFRLRVSRKEPLHLRERFGLKLPPRPDGRPLVWLHAVSVGEILSLQILARELKAGHPEWSVGISTLTQRGFELGREKLGTVDLIFFIPFDLSFSVRRILRGLRPRLLVLVESEFWPNLLCQAQRNSCPVILVNGRISDRTFGRFKRFRIPVLSILRRVDRFLVQTKQDRERLMTIGMPEDRIEVSGNLKCDVRLPELGREAVRALKEQLAIPETKKVVVAGSIHKGEEGLILEAFREARRIRPDIVLVLAPRHPEKFGDIDKNLETDGIAFCRRKSVRAGQVWDVLILDTIGELAKFYALSDAAFVGGSLIPRGGQNLLEPAFYGKPIFFGPHMENFAELAEEFVKGGAAKIVSRASDIREMFLFARPDDLRDMGQRAKEILSSLQGATGRTVRAIERFMR